MFHETKSFAKSPKMVSLSFCIPNIENAVHCTGRTEAHEGTIKASDATGLVVPARCCTVNEALALEIIQGVSRKSFAMVFRMILCFENVYT
jgi:hypothetical protein